MNTTTLRMSLAALITASGLLANNAYANFQYLPDTNAPASSGMPITPSPAPMPSVTRQTLPTAPALPAAPAPSRKSASQNGAVINGFGKQLPLVIALREIVPSTYQFAFADGINLGTLVNWNGGKSWRAVMNNVVTSLGLTATEKNMVIYIDQQH